jgi:hypothetical protein
VPCVQTASFAKFSAISDSQPGDPHTSASADANDNVEIADAAPNHNAEIAGCDPIILFTDSRNVIALLKGDAPPVERNLVADYQEFTSTTAKKTPWRGSTPERPQEHDDDQQAKRAPNAPPPSARVEPSCRRLKSTKCPRN